MTKDELLANIKRDRARLDEIVRRLDAATMVDPRLDGGWSVKDVLAHITAWEQFCLEWVLTGKGAEPALTPEQIEAFNAKTYAENRDRPLTDVATASGRSSAEMLAAVEALTQEELSAPPAWANRTRLDRIISVNADEHYREHSDQIEAWLRGAA